MFFTVAIKVAQTACGYGGERHIESRIPVQVDERGRRFYYPDHLGDLVSTQDGSAEVVEVSDHECTAVSGCAGICGRDHSSSECCVDEIDVPAE